MPSELGSRCWKRILRACAGLLVGLPDVNIDGVGDWPGWLGIVITTRGAWPCCQVCNGPVHRHDVDEVELTDVPCFGRRTRCVWMKHRWRCPNPNCGVVTFTETDERIAAGRAGITDRAGQHRDLDGAGVYVDRISAKAKPAEKHDKLTNGTSPTESSDACGKMNYAASNDPTS